MKKGSRKTHCKRGHSRTPENLNKNLACKICRALLGAKEYANNREERKVNHRAYYASHKQEAKDRRAANPEGVAAYKESVKGRFNTLKGAAKSRGILMELTLEEYADLVRSGFCVYNCGNSLPLIGTGIDRKISSLGYSTNNCVPCCMDCNRMRGEDLISYEEMFEVIKLLQKIRGF
jgi:hypothetical protein